MKKKYRTISDLIHSKFCVTMERILMDGFIKGYWLWENFHPWDFIKTALSTKDGVYTDRAVSPLELEVSAMVAKLDLKNELPEKSQKLSALFCEGLESRMFSAWFKTFLQNESEIKRRYGENSILRSTVVGDIIELFNLVSGFPFALNYMPTSDRSLLLESR